MCVRISRERRTIREKSHDGAFPPWSGSEAYPVRWPGAMDELYCARTARYATLWADASSVLFKGDLMAKTAKKSAPQKANAAFMKPMTISPQLAEVIGDKPMP